MNKDLLVHKVARIYYGELPEEAYPALMDRELGKFPVSEAEFGVISVRPISCEFTGEKSTLVTSEFVCEALTNNNLRRLLK